MVQDIEAYAEEYFLQHKLPEDVFTFSWTNEDGKISFYMNLNYPNVVRESHPTGEFYLLHSLPLDTLLSIYEEDGLNNYLEDNIEPVMPTSFLGGFHLPNGYTYIPERFSALRAYMPTEPVVRQVSSVTDGLDPRRFLAYNASSVCQEDLVGKLEMKVLKTRKTSDNSLYYMNTKWLEDDVTIKCHPSP